MFLLRHLEASALGTETFICEAELTITGHHQLKWNPANCGHWPKSWFTLCVCLLFHTSVYIYGSGFIKLSLFVCLFGAGWVIIGHKSKMTDMNKLHIWSHFRFTRVQSGSPLSLHCWQVTKAFYSLWVSFLAVSFK